MRTFLGIDAGTQGTKVALIDENGALLREADAPTRLAYAPDGAITQDPEEMLASVVQAVAKLQATCCDGIAISAQMAGVVGVNANGEAAMPYDSWLDQRCECVLDHLKPMEKELMDASGGQLMSACGAKILWWTKQGNTYRNLRYVTANAYLAMRLTGSSCAYVDATHLHFMLFADQRRQCWNTNAMEQTGIPQSVFPEICSSQEKIGTLSAEMASKMGLFAGIPVYAGCGDTAAGIFGAGVTELGQAADIAGTASVLAMVRGDFRPDIEKKMLLTMKNVAGEGYVQLAYVGGGGLCLRWFRDLMGKSYAELDALAASVPPGSGPLFSPHFAGRACPADANASGMFHGLKWTHQAGHLYRSILEAIGYEYEIYRRAAGFHGVITAVGGGTNSRLFSEIKANATGQRYCVCALKDTGAYGAALLARLAATGSMPAHAIQGQEVLPNDGIHHLYTQRIFAYERLLAQR